MQPRENNYGFLNFWQWCSQMTVGSHLKEFSLTDVDWDTSTNSELITISKMVLESSTRRWVSHLCCRWTRSDLLIIFSGLLTWCWTDEQIRWILLNMWINTKNDGYPKCHIFPTEVILCLYQKDFVMYIQFPDTPHLLSSYWINPCINLQCVWGKSWTELNAI